MVRCGNRIAHGSCGFSKTAKITSDVLKGRWYVNNNAQGRPLGYLVAWCLAESRFMDRDLHMDYKPSHDDRVAARKCLTQSRNGRLLLRCEREVQPGESVEPVECA